MSSNAATDLTTLESYPQRYFEAWSQRDIDVALDVISPQVDWRDPSLPAPITDHEGARDFFVSAWQGFPDLKFEAIGTPIVDVARRRVTHEWRMIGTHTGEGFPPGVPPTGKPFDIPGADIWEVDEHGRAVSVRAYWDVATLMRQLGLI
ncbi:ester cyclase [Rhodococcus zopfii]|uniref:Ester cyclase n=1 Tax=Rhodococcus zopfii TaxID=43772 RepID=A0ABU3WSY7_9NOCA|nr:ester cyclase [Rhodococcus zopfii]